MYITMIKYIYIYMFKVCVSCISSTYCQAILSLLHPKKTPLTEVFPKNICDRGKTLQR